MSPLSDTAIASVYPSSPILDHNKSNVPSAHLYGNGPSVTYIPLFFCASAIQLASLALNNKIGSPTALFKSALISIAHISPSFTCTHSWQKIIYGLPLLLMYNVPSSDSQSGGVIVPSLCTVNLPSGLSAFNTIVPRHLSADLNDANI